MSLRFSRVDTAEKFEAWKKFSAEFGHQNDAPYLPLTTVSEDGEQFGYWSALTLPIVMPAFHTEKTTPRRFKAMAEAISNAYQIASLGAIQHPNGACYLALEDTPAVSEEIIRKLGFKDLGLKLWRKA